MIKKEDMIAVLEEFDYDLPALCKEIVAQRQTNDNFVEIVDLKDKEIEGLKKEMADHSCL